MDKAFKENPVEAYEKLKQEYEELKKDYATAKSMYDLCQSDFMELAKIKDKLKQTLAEIKKLLLKTPTDSKEHCVNAKSVILQKINECEMNDERI